MPRPKLPPLREEDIGRLDRDWYSVRDLAWRLQVNEETIQDWIRGTNSPVPLPATWLGGSAGYRIAHEDLIAFLKQRRGLRPVRATERRARASAPDPQRR
jgi:hypothetical protein